MRTQITINKSHYVERLDTYRYQFSKAVNMSGAKMSLLSCSVYNSVYNVKASYNNNKIGIKWINGVIYEFTIPDGVYSISDISDFLKLQMFTNDLYAIIKTTNKPYYFFELAENPIYYACQIVVSYVPNTSEAVVLDYEKPSGANWNWPSQSITPQLYLFTEGMGRLLGYNNLIIPQQPVVDENFETKSEKAPELSPVFNYVMNSNCFNHELSTVGFNQVFFQIPINKGTGESLIYQPSFLMDLSCIGTQDYLEFYFTDEDGNRLQYRDKDISMIIIIDFPPNFK
jgi:hypothetical protein